MPLDVNCPKCNRVFPVTEAKSAIGVQCPGCESDLTAEFRKRPTPVPGEHPYELFVSVGRPVGAPPLPSKKKPRTADEDDEAMRGGGGGMAVVVVAGLGALVLALAGLGGTGYVLFTNLDTSDSTIGNINSNTGTKGSNTPKGGPNPRLGPSPRGNTTPKGGPFVPGTPPEPTFEPFEPPPKKPRDEFDLKTVAGTQQPINPPTIDLTKPVTLNLPGIAEAVTVGGNGRYIVFHIPSSQQLTVFDANRGGFVATEKVPDAGPLLLAGGQNRVVTCSRESRVLRSYTLPELRKEYDFNYPLFHFPDGIAMGSGVNSPLLVSDPFAHVALVELANSGAKVVDGSKTEAPPNLPAQPVGNLRAAPNGKLFLFARGNDRGEKTGVLSESGRKWKTVSLDMTTASPSADGRHLFGFGQIVEANNGRRVGNWVGNDGGAVWYVGGTCGRAFLRLAQTQQNGKGAVSISVHNSPQTVERDKAGVQLGVLPETEGLIDWFRGVALQLDKHLFLIPDAKLLVVLPASKDKLILRKVDVRN